MFCFVIFLCLIFVLNLCCASVFNGSNLKDGIKFDGLSHDGSRISSRDAKSMVYIKPEEAKFMAAINVNYGIFRKECSGAFITQYFHVLTNAHCVHDGQEKVPVKYVKIRYGSRYAIKDGKTISVALVSIHPLYSEYYYDVAVLTPNEKIDKTVATYLHRGNPEYAAFQLNSLIEREDVASIYGYGIHPNRDFEGAMLMMVNVTFMPYKKCKSVFDYIPEVDKFLGNRFCVFTPKVNPCEGDGGAILTHETIPGVLGLFSYGKLCGERSRPALFSIMDATSTSFIDSAVRAIAQKSRSYSFEPGLGPIYGFLLILGMRFTNG